LRIGVAADTQGRYDVDAVVRNLAVFFRGCDQIWFAGDWQDERILDGLADVAHLVVVSGNAPADDRYPGRVMQVLEGHRVGMTHVLTPGARDWARQLDLFIYAHSHRFHDEMIEGTRYLNPGTVTQPRFGSTERTAAIVDLAPGRIGVTRLDL
jgi:putative phosphoesterase